jgi:hypothetical protein
MQIERTKLTLLLADELYSPETWQVQALSSQSQNSSFGSSPVVFPVSELRK